MLIADRSVLYISGVLGNFVSEYACLSNIRTITCSTREFVNPIVHILSILLFIFGIIKSYMSVPVATRSNA
jgi:hypothetical protein